MLDDQHCSQQLNNKSHQSGTPNPMCYAMKGIVLMQGDPLPGKLSGLPGEPLQPPQSSGLMADGPDMIPLYTHTLHMCLQDASLSLHGTPVPIQYHW